MKKQLKILLLEDSMSDVELILREIKKSGIDFTSGVASGKEEFINAFISFKPDVVLADHSLPGFDSQEAFRIFQTKKLKIPFILVTGTMSEEFAVQVLKDGVDDYILKHSLTRLPAAILAALKKKKIEKENDDYRKELERKVIRRTKELQESHEKLRYSEALTRATLNSINDIIFIINKEEKIVLYNTAFKNKIGSILNIPTDPEDLSVDEILRQLCPDDCNRYKEIFATGVGLHNLEIRPCNGGGKFFYEFSQIPVFDNRKVSFIVTSIHDISLIKNAEKEIQLNLEKEKELNMLKSRFISTVAHEFRTPLAGIQTSIELLERNIDKWDVAKRGEVFQTIYGLIRYNTVLLNDVSIVGKDDCGKLSFTPAEVNLKKFLKKLTDEISLSFNIESIIQLEDQLTSEIFILDINLIQHILTNLLTNAVKYSMSKEPVNIEVSESGDNIKFIINDKGIGIPPEEIEHIFEPFHRSDNVSDIKGTGLGLSITKRCVDLHNGMIRVVSEVGVGTTVTVILPYQKP